MEIEDLAWMSKDAEVTTLDGGDILDMYGGLPYRRGW
jgi:hypothetical protein